MQQQDSLLGVQTGKLDWILKISLEKCTVLYDISSYTNLHWLTPWVQLYFQSNMFCWTSVPKRNLGFSLKVSCRVFYLEATFADKQSRWAPSTCGSSFSYITLAETIPNSVDFALSSSTFSSAYLYCGNTNILKEPHLLLSHLLHCFRALLRLWILLFLHYFLCMRPLGYIDGRHWWVTTHAFSKQPIRCLPQGCFVLYFPNGSSNIEVFEIHI